MLRTKVPRWLKWHAPHSHTEAVEELDVEGILAFAERILPRASGVPRALPGPDVFGGPPPNVYSIFTCCVPPDMPPCSCLWSRTFSGTFPSMRLAVRRGLVPIAVLTLATTAEAQPPHAAVRYTEARRHDLRPAVTLPGVVEVPRVSTVAAEVGGVVEALHAREGTRVQRDGVMVVLRTAALQLQIAALEAEGQEAEARRALAEREFDRARELFRRGILSGQQLETAEYEFRAREGRSAQLRADVERLRDSLARSEIRAPFDGVVVRRYTEVGQWVAAGGPVLEVHGSGEFDVAVDVPERYYVALRQGQIGMATFDALPGKSVRARVVTIVPRATQQSGTFPIKLRLEGPGSASVAAGMLAAVALPLGMPATVTIVPKDAVTRDAASQQVLIVDEAGTVRAAAVTTGSQTGAWVAVTGDVRPGMRVLTRGNERVRPGQVVVGQPMTYPLP